jgi:hypothetical protein
MSFKESALKRRIPPSVPLTLELQDHTGAKSSKSFMLCFDFNAIATVEEMTGLGMLNGEIWELFGRDEEEKKGDVKQSKKHVRPKGSGAKALGVMFWAGVLAHHPEYDSEEGLAVIRSYMDAGNAVQIAGALQRAFVASLPKAQQEAIAAVPEDGAPLAIPATKKAISAG